MGSKTAAWQITSWLLLTYRYRASFHHICNAARRSSCMRSRTHAHTHTQSITHNHRGNHRFLTVKSRCGALASAASAFKKTKSLQSAQCTLSAAGDPAKSASLAVTSPADMQFCKHDMMLSVPGLTSSSSLLLQSTLSDFSILLTVVC